MEPMHTNYIDFSTAARENVGSIIIVVSIVSFN